MQAIRWIVGIFFALAMLSFLAEGRILLVLGIVGVLVLIGGSQIVLALLWQSTLQVGNRNRTLSRRIARTAASDRFADGLLEALESGEPTPRFVLYLRPFDIDRRARLDVHLDQYNAYVTSVESMLTQALGSTLPVVGIGAELGGDRPGMVEAADSEWQTTFELLVTRASLVCAVPIMRPGLVWEMERLAEWALLEKTCLLVPPHRAVGSLAEDLDRAMQLLKKLGYQIPELGKEGGVVRVGVGGNGRRHYDPFPTYENQMRADIERLFPLSL